MAKKDLNTEVLIQIRDELRATRTDLGSRIDVTNQRIDSTRIELVGRLDATRTQLSERIEATRTQLSERIEATNEHVLATNERLDRLARLQTESEVRIATELVAVAGTVRELRDTLLEDRRLRQQVDEHERRITELENAH